MLEETRSNSALVTLGADGLIAFDRLPESPGTRDDGTWRAETDEAPGTAPTASEFEKARRVAFMLAQGARALPAPTTAASTAKE